MDPIRLYLPFLIPIIWNVYDGVLCVTKNLHFIRFSREKFLDGNVCPSGNVIQNTRYIHGMKCLTLCSTQSQCHGVFLEPNAKRCVTCSARNFTNNTSTLSKFYKRHDLRSYRLIEQPMRWDIAKQNCEDLGGHLAIIRSEEENDYIVQLANASADIESIYIGGKGMGGRAETFHWIDGSTLQNGYTNWIPNQPNPIIDSERYLVMKRDSNFQWNDVGNTEYASICEFD